MNRLREWGRLMEQTFEYGGKSHKVMMIKLEPKDATEDGGAED